MLGFQLGQLGPLGLDDLGRGPGDERLVAQLGPERADLAVQVGQRLPQLGALGLLVDQALQRQDDLGVGQDGDGATRPGARPSATIVSELGVRSGSGGRPRPGGAASATARLGHDDRARSWPPAGRSARPGGCGSPVIFSCHWATVASAVRVAASRRVGRARRRCRRSRPRLGFGQAAAAGRAWPSGLPDLLGHERHDRVEQPAEPSSTAASDALGDRAGRRVAEPGLDELDVPVAEVVPGEVAEPPGGLGEPERLQVGGRRGDRLVEPAQDPAVLDGQARRASTGPGS